MISISISSGMRTENPTDASAIPSFTATQSIPEFIQNIFNQLPTITTTRSNSNNPIINTLFSNSGNNIDRIDLMGIQAVAALVMLMGACYLFAAVTVPALPALIPALLFLSIGYNSYQIAETLLNGPSTLEDYLILVKNKITTPNPEEYKKKCTFEILSKNTILFDWVIRLLVE